MLPLIPYLRAGHQNLRRALCGEGDLIRHLESFGLRCVYAGDIRTGQDALALDHYGAADAIITNPPYTRDLMHRLIDALPAHRADVAAIGSGLGIDPAGGAVPAATARTS